MHRKIRKSFQITSDSTYLLRLLKILVLLLFGLSSSYAQNGPTPSSHEKTSLRIALLIQGTNGNDAIVTSYLSRAFRKLGDVTLVNYTFEGNPMVVVDAIVGVVHNSEGFPLGYTLSYSVCSRVPNIVIAEAINDPTVSTEKQKLIAYWLNNKGVLVDHFTQTSTKSKLEETCAENVAEIDADVLEPIRKALDSIR
jgi:hypothetical protein